MTMGSGRRWWQSSQRLGCFGAVLFRLASTTNNSATAFGLHRIVRGYFTHSVTRDSAGQRRHRIFSQPSTSTAAGDEGLLQSDEESHEVNDADYEAPIEVLNGTAENFIVTKLYHVPIEGFRESSHEDDDVLSLSTVFSPDDIMRLRLESLNVTLPAALMLLDPDRYPTQSRARKVIRQRSICICRNRGNQSNTSATLEFDELGKVITRILRGDAIGYQRRAGSDYYAVQGAPYRPPPFEVPVAYEDDHVAVVNKPAGVVMYRTLETEGGRGGGHGRDTLLSALPYVLRPSNFHDDIDDDGGGGGARNSTILRRPQPVHRLDRPVSGLVVVAKTKSAIVHLSKQFEFRKARKTYVAIVNGRPRKSTANENEASSSGWNTIDYDLDGKSAITEWRAVREVKSLHGRDGRLTLVELRPKTGRYHQLRRHMAWVCNSPLVGDTTYDEGDDSALRLRKRGLFLCSNEIELEHPHYNTQSGRKEWIAMGGREIRLGDALLWENEARGMVMIRARTELPAKFESFLRHEDARADKFLA